MRLLCLPLFGIALGLAPGCSSASPQPPNFGGEDGKQIAELVDLMNDESNSLSQLKAAFATGTPLGPKETKVYSQYRYDLKGKPTVSETTATGTVVIEKHTAGEPVEKEWTFVKEGDKWKLKSAPLP